MNGLDNWLKTPPGRYALAWEQAQFDAVVADIFGYHALQLGLTAAIDALAANRMPHRWRAALTAPDEMQADATGAPAANPAPRVALIAGPAALPFPEASLDLIALPHTLDLCPDPQTAQAALHEAGRALVHEGCLIVTGIDPISLWRLSGALAGASPAGNKPVTPRRLRALLRDTDLELQAVRRGGHGFAPCAWRDEARLDRWGAHLWPALGALWCAIAVKRSRGAILVGPAWKTQPAAAGAQAGVAQRTEPMADSLSR
ncbi:MAG: class I SAM-dependent methyltransferase [Burkholderiaceae bacterium]|jgi:SAM-dependent methyltransferase|nr:class I SAM-dependent methyltransferase [Burkholderiaceae bacterium]